MQGHASGLQLQLELVLKSEQWAPCAADAAVQAFLDYLFESQANSGAHQVDFGTACGPAANGVKSHNADGDADRSLRSADASPRQVEDSASLATALDSAVNTQEAAQRLQGRQGGDDRQQGAAGSQDHRGKTLAEIALHIGNARFVVVGSAGLLLQHIESLLAFGHAHLALRYEMGTRIAALIRAFDTGSQELLLGAAAISSAGLRSITARHMGVCSQCLLLLEVVLPRLRGIALEGLPAAQVASLATIYESVAEVRCSMPFAR